MSLQEIANKMTELQQTMIEALDEFTDLVQEADKEGELIGLNLMGNFKAYTHAHLTVNLRNDHEYLSNDRNLNDIIDSVVEAADELDNMEDED